MITVFVNVEAKHGERVVFKAQVDGYYQRLGVTARTQDELITIIREHIAEDTGGTLVDVAEIWVPDFEGADSDLKDVCDDTSKVGIWYWSGRAFFGPGAEGDDDIRLVEFEDEENST